MKNWMMENVLLEREPPSNTKTLNSPRVNAECSRPNTGVAFMFSFLLARLLQFLLELQVGFLIVGDIHADLCLALVL